MYLLRLVLAWDVVKESRLLITMAEGKDPYRLDGVSNRSSHEEDPPPSSRPPALSSLSDPEPMAAVCLPTLPTLLFESWRFPRPAFNLPTPSPPKGSVCREEERANRSSVPKVDGMDSSCRARERTSRPLVRVSLPTTAQVSQSHSFGLERAAAV